MKRCIEVVDYTFGGGTAIPQARSGTINRRPPISKHRNMPAVTHG